jgi:23S rRNA (cytidine1920-2'-O)/16S rRNA (cytidine1409-2'-O)-methyltransferase
VGKRLDVELVQRGLFSSRTKAQAAVAAGFVSVDGVVTLKVNTRISAGCKIVISQQDPYVSRAAHKLIGALEASGTQIFGRVLDAGASTGGFTQVVLERGAERVYAVDVGHGQLDASLREDPRVRVWEGLNLRDLELAHLEDELVDFAVGDVSFISLKLILAPILKVLRLSGMALLLVKPQFEVGRSGLDSAGVVKDQLRRDKAVADVIETAAELGWETVWSEPSGLVGEHGNVEYFIKLIRT